MLRVRDAIRFFKFGINQGAFGTNTGYAEMAIEGLEVLEKIQRQELTVCGYSAQELVLVAQMMEDLHLHPAEIRQMCTDMKKMYETMLLHSSVTITRSITGNLRSVRHFPDFRTVMKAMNGGGGRG